MAELLFGTSGWSYDDWVRVFYRSVEERRLQRYSRVFRTVEIDSTFYSYPDPRIIKAMERAVPEGFIFSAKVPRLITHKKKLRDVERDLERFIETFKPLRSSKKLGAFLIQLPPSFTFEREGNLFENFLENLPSGYEFAVEFRDPSWLREEALKILSRYDVAYTIVDEPLLPPDIHVTADFSYIRWHGRGERPWYNYHYRREELELWKDRLKKLEGRVSKIYGYFNNHFHGYAVHNCLQILEILEVITPEQRKVLEEVEDNLTKPRPLTESLSLYVSPEKIPEDLQELLELLTSKSRLMRAKKMNKNLIKTIELSENYLHAKVKEYEIIIDLEKRTILHNCADWRRVGAELKLCKHVAALFLHISEGYAKNVLKDLVMNRGSWSFRSL